MTVFFLYRATGSIVSTQPSLQSFVIGGLTTTCPPSSFDHSLTFLLAITLTPPIPIAVRLDTTRGGNGSLITQKVQQQQQQQKKERKTHAQSMPFAQSKLSTTWVQFAIIFFVQSHLACFFASQHTTHSSTRDTPRYLQNETQLYS